MLISQELPSSRDPINREQAVFMAILIQELVDEERIETDLNSGPLELEDFFNLPAYLRFISGAYACGFVCSDLTPDSFDISRPDIVRVLQEAPFEKIRAFTHVLLRSERWADGMWSPVRNILATGALAAVGSRLNSDISLYGPA